MGTLGKGAVHTPTSAPTSTPSMGIQDDDYDARDLAAAFGLSEKCVALRAWFDPIAPTFAPPTKADCALWKKCDLPFPGCGNAQDHDALNITTTTTTAATPQTRTSRTGRFNFAWPTVPRTQQQAHASTQTEGGCPSDFPYPSPLAFGILCFDQQQYATRGKGPCDTWCTKYAMFWGNCETGSTTPHHNYNHTNNVDNPHVCSAARTTEAHPTPAPTHRMTTAPSVHSQGADKVVAPTAQKHGAAVTPTLFFRAAVGNPLVRNPSRTFNSTFNTRRPPPPKPSVLPLPRTTPTGGTLDPKMIVRGKTATTVLHATQLPARTVEQAETTTTAAHGARIASTPSDRASAAPDNATGPSIQAQYTVLVGTAIIVLCMCVVMGTHVKTKLSQGRASMSGHPAHATSFKSRHAAPDYAKFDNLVFDAGNVIHGSELLELGVLDDLLLPDLATQHQAPQNVSMFAEGDAQIHAPITAHGGFKHVSGGYTHSVYGMVATYAPEGQSFAHGARGLGAQGDQHTACMPPLPDLGESLGLPTLGELSPSLYEPWINATMSHSTGAYHDPAHVKLEPAGMQMQVPMNMVQKQTKEEMMQMQMRGGSACSLGVDLDLGADGVLQTARPLSPPPVRAATLEPRNFKGQYADVVDLNDIFLEGNGPLC